MRPLPHHAAYAAAAGAWEPSGGAVEGRCGLCGGEGRVWPMLGVVSKAFSLWSMVAVSDEGRRWVCAACGWALSDRSLRRMSWMADDEGWRALGDGDAGGLLANGPLGAGTSMVVAVSGKKTVAPMARWGRVAWDGGVVAWDGGCARCLRAGLWLRASAGLSERDLGGHELPWWLLGRAGPAGLRAARQAWGAWRAGAAGPRAPLMIRLTRASGTPRRVRARSMRGDDHGRS